MNLQVATRHDGPLMRVEVEGPWRNGDALKLAYLIKVKATRTRDHQVLVDLRGVQTPPDAVGKFVICDRLKRALTPSMRIGLVGSAELVDTEVLPKYQAHCPDIALFGAEPDALRWLGVVTQP